MRGPRIAVYGATGTTGALVVAEVLRRALPCRAVARDAGALAALAAEYPGLPTQTSTTASLAAALVDIDVVINSAGPFCETRRAVEDAAMAARIPVVHLCGEPDELAALFARDDELRAAGITVVAAAGFASAMSELACWLAVQGMAVQGLAVQGLARPVGLEVVHGAVASVPSVGSLRSYLAGAQVVFEGASDIKVVELPSPVGPRAVRRAALAEGMTLRRSLGIHDVCSWIAVGPPRAVVVKPAVFLHDPAALERMLAWRQAHGTRGPSALERAAMAFALQATARTAQGTSRTVDVVGSDPYGLTALLSVQVAVDVVRSPKPGARAPLEVLDPQPALDALAAAGVRFMVQPSSPQTQS